jgi:RimJ/RimL family protein N-acetyltransferase
MPVERGSIQIVKARPEDALTLAQISERAFGNDVHYGAPGPGGPPGYKSEGWQKRMMRMADYYKILAAGQVVGGVIVFRKEPRVYDLGRIFVEPDHQNQGVGTEVFELLWQEYPLAKRWTLGTPAWNQRTRHFYKKVGFQEIGDDRRGGVLLQRVIHAMQRPVA